MKNIRWVFLWGLFTFVKTREAPLGPNFNNIFNEHRTLPEAPLHESFELVNDVENRKGINSPVNELKGIIENANHVSELRHFIRKGDPNQQNVKEENIEKTPGTFQDQSQGIDRNIDSEFDYLSNIDDDFMIRYADQIDYGELEKIISSHISQKREKRSVTATTDSNDIGDSSDNSNKRVRRKTTATPNSHDISDDTGDSSDNSKKREKRNVIPKHYYDGTLDDTGNDVSFLKYSRHRPLSYSLPSNENKFKLRDFSANDYNNVMKKQLLEDSMNFNKCECNAGNRANSLCCYLKPHKKRRFEKETAKNKPRNIQKAISKLNKYGKYINTRNNKNKHTVALSRLGNRNGMDTDENYSTLSMDVQRVDEEEDLSKGFNQNSASLEVPRDPNNYSYNVDKTQVEDYDIDNSVNSKEENIDTHDFKGLVNYILS